MKPDLDAFWMPFTANRQFKKAPRLLAKSAGMHYWDDKGRQILDGVAGLWCVNAGHARPKIVQAIQEQAAEMDFAPPFQMAHPKAFELAEKVAKLAPAGMNKVFFTNSGSESVETALKMAIAYHRARGEGARTRLIGRERGYHGVNFGGISVGGMVGNRKMFGTLLAASTTSATRTTWRATPSASASPSMAPNWPTTWNAWSRCTTRRPSPRSSSSRSPAPPAC